MLKKISSTLAKFLSVPPASPEVVQQIASKINYSLTSSYQSAEMQRYLQSLPVNSLLHKSVEYFVGSKTTPRNEVIMRILLQCAEKKANASGDQELKNQVQYFYAYYVKLQALQHSDEKEYDRASHMFMKIAETGHHLSNYLVGKEIYKMIETGEMGSWTDLDLITKCQEMFINSLSPEQYGGLFYIAQMEENRILSSGEKIDDEKNRMLMELYIQSASLGFTLSYFKLSLKYKQMGDFKLYKKYLLLAAEEGVIEAQHNLALEYLNGEHFVKNQIKAVAWFIQASAHGFVYSKYNLSQIFKQGTSCGSIKPNPKASLVYLEEIHRSGEIDVSKEIEQITKIIDANSSSSK